MPLTVSVIAWSLNAVRRQPLPAVPGANQIACLRLRDLQRQQRLRPERLLDLFVRNERGRSAELAAFADLLWIEDRNRLAALTPDRHLVGLPATRRVGNAAKGLRQIVLDDHGVGADRLQLRRRLRPAERADERLFGGVPVASAPQAGQLNFCRADATVARPAASGRPARSCRVALLEEVAMAVFVIRHCVPISCP